MNFDISKNSNASDVIENMKILATTVEAINQQLQNQGNIGGNNQTNAKLDNLNNGLKVFCDKILADQKTVQQKYTNINSELINTKNMLNYVSQKQSSELKAIGNKIDSHISNYNKDIQKVFESLNQNAVILELLKQTIYLLNETLNIVKENKSFLNHNKNGDNN